MAGANPESRWFGFRPVDESEKTNLVRGVFSSVASRYDLMNDLMSCGLHRLWKDLFVRRMNPKKGQSFLDVAGGTGDIAQRIYRKTKGKANITVCDINPAMLEQGKAKALDHGIVNGIDWVEGNAEALPFADRTMDRYSIVFGLRNVTHIDTALRDAYRVLKPGGKFFCMEFSSGTSPLLKPFYEAYCLNIMPFLGDLVAQDREAYQYLAESIIRFPDQKTLANRMEKAGFSTIAWTDLMGGVAVIHEGFRL
ncbi:MAG: bifunctional demethylmenaquinone methyltransferase/2-methoxy-6-polyprenyl-1,4-benzoquinol methylase UbiE [Alphaproteobacteria bacterium]|nr:bifunctional demethylmenaquinone methyltransferase/2-methoxy-6-polyprenyl-1,4-benzoquinol methylase UbiE [Alphaproteobacteria bacterium]